MIIDVILRWTYTREEKKYELRIHMIKSKVAGQNSWLLIITALGSSTNGDRLYGKTIADKAVEDFLLLIKN